MFNYNDAVKKHRDLILKTQETIWVNPETGYREVKTTKFMEDTFEALGYSVTRAGDIPGFYTVIDTGKEGPEILILSELDSLILSDHPDADPVTGAVHCCGHNAQCGAMVGIAAALKEPGALDELCGRIRLAVVPAEELIEIEYRTGLKEQGVIHYFGGKPEFLYRGYFDGVDIAYMLHTAGGDEFGVDDGSVGCVAKRITYKGVSAHACATPSLGVNALYAATLGLSAINAIRETFREPDIIRVHPIITKGGGAVNAIPDEVIIESYVRSSNYEAMLDANKRVNRALIGAALSLGANIDIQDTPGYGPSHNAPGMISLMEDAAKAIPEIPFKKTPGIGSGSTDMGDLSAVMPTIHGYAPGSVGKGHGADYYIADPDKACVASAQLQLQMLALLLKDGGSRAKEILANFKPRFASKEEYFAFIEAFSRKGDCIEYIDGKAIAAL